MWPAGVVVGSADGTARIGDVALHYEIRGSTGPWLTLLHGGMMPGVGWDDQAARLGDVARVLTFDQRGYGSSSTVAGRCSIAQRAQDLRGLWDVLGVARSVLAGFSMGGFVAIETALTAPGRVSALLLAGTAAGLDDAQREGFRRRADEIEARGIGAGLQAATHGVFGPSFRAEHPEVLQTYRELVATSDSRCIAASFRGLADFDRRADAARIGCPTIVVHGDHDEAIPAASGRALQAQIAGSRLEVFAGAGHTVHMEDPDRFEGLLRELVAAAPGLRDGPVL